MDSIEVRSPSPQKANLEQITSLLDDDEDCFYQDTMQSLALARQKSKTEYTKRSTEQKDSNLSTI